MTQHKGNKNKKGESVPKKGIKPYVKPRLTEYGHIEKLTEGAGATLPDAGGKRKA